MSLKENKDIIKRYTDECCNKGNIALIDELFAVDFVHHFLPGPGDLEAFRQYQKSVLIGLPDVHITTHDLIAEGDKVVKYFTASGTHKGEFMGVPATGNKIEVIGLEIFRIANGKIAEAWGVLDSLTLMQQLGVIPSEG